MHSFESKSEVHRQYSAILLLRANFMLYLAEQVKQIQQKSVVHLHNSSDIIFAPSISKMCKYAFMATFENFMTVKLFCVFVTLQTTLYILSAYIFFSLRFCFFIWFKRFLSYRSDFSQTSFYHFNEQVLFFFFCYRLNLACLSSIYTTLQNRKIPW